VPERVGYLQIATHPMRNLNQQIRSRVRAVLTARGASTCSDIVRAMGLDPRHHKGTIHAIMCEMEREGILWAPVSGKRRQRSLWFLMGEPRKRDQIRALLMRL
jgi:hypothetical protein